MMRRSILGIGSVIAAALFGIRGAANFAPEPPAFLNMGLGPISSAPRARRRRYSRYEPHQGKRECARRMRQVAAGQIHFIKHGPKI